ncbi:TRAP transporter large permease [Chloroflexota bacterium]
MLEPSWIWGIVEIALLVVLCMVGVHVFAATGIVGAVFSIIYLGFVNGIIQVGTVGWDQMNNYHFSMIPLFVLMGTWVASAGLGKDAVDAAMRWLARVKGSLATVSVFANAFFAACEGSLIASLAAIGSICLPEMKRYGYSAALRTGALSSGSMLSNLIPPSGMAIIYSILTDQSVGKLFIAGIVPGLILVVLFCSVIFVWATLRPQDAPPLPPEVRFTLAEKIKGTALIAPIIIIFVVIILGIYMGWFSPTEAAGIGATTVLIVALAYRRMNWHSFRTGLREGILLSVMVLFVIITAFIFSYTIVATGLSRSIGNLVEAAGLSYIPVSYAISIIFLILGCFLNPVALQVLFIPLFFPVITTVTGAPPMAGIWFGVLVIMLIEVGFLTPPVAPALYVVQMLDGCPTKDVFKGVVPFYAASVLLIVLLIHFPFLATWLPSKMIGA